MGLYDGQFLVNEQDFLLVTINYRLGVFGFLVYMFLFKTTFIGNRSNRGQLWYSGSENGYDLGQGEHSFLWRRS